MQLFCAEIYYIFPIVTDNVWNALLQDRQIQALKERQEARKKMIAMNQTGSSSTYGSHSKTSTTPRRSAFGAAAAREMHAGSRGSGAIYDDLSETGKSYGHKTFT